MNNSTIKEFKNSHFQKVTNVSDSLKELFTQTLALYPTIKLYDYGCGYGGWIDYIASQCSDFQYKVFDVDKHAEDFTKNLYANCYREDLNEFNIILIFAVLELFDREQQKKVLLDLKNSLSPNGRLIIQYNVYNKFHLRWFLFFLLGKGNAITYHEKKFHRSYLTIQEVEILFRECGFTIQAWASKAYYPKFPNWLNKMIAKVFKSRYFYSNLFYTLSRAD